MIKDVLKITQNALTENIINGSFASVGNEMNQFGVAAEAFAHRLRELEERVRALEERERKIIEEEQYLEEERRKQEELRAFLDAYPPTRNAHRVHQKKKLEEHDLTYLGARSRHGALMIFRRPRGDEVRVIVYVVNSRNSAGQCVFSINHLEDDTADWALLVAWPFRRFYLKKISEIRTRFAAKARGGTAPKQANVTIREGSPPDDLFEHRIRELVDGD